MLLCDICDQLLDQHGLTYTGTSEETNLTTLLIRTQKINDLNTCLKDLCGCRLLLKGWCFSMNRIILYVRRCRLLINRLTQYVKHTSQCRLTNRNTDRTAGSFRCHTTL